VFHKRRNTFEQKPSEESVRKMVEEAEARIECGLGCRKDEVAAIDFEDLERKALNMAPVKCDDNGLLQAVAGAVAEAGPWDASMDMVARRSGLSKSGLYAHFKSKQDMVQQFFLTEFGRLMDYTELVKQNSEAPLEKLYLAIMAIVSYLCSKPEILTAIDWIRTRRLDMGHPIPPSLFRIFSDIHLSNLPDDSETAEGQEMLLSHWILFLIINILMHRPNGCGPSGCGSNGCGSGKKEDTSSAGDASGAVPSDTEYYRISISSIRVLFRFIILGIGGFDI
jgi:AcrR family transcriptional regulator